MKQLFRMNDEQFAYMMEQMKTARNQRVMYIGNGVPLFENPQEIANRAWKRLADEMGFVWGSAEPGEDERSFNAEPLLARRPAAQAPQSEDWPNFGHGQSAEPIAPAAEQGADGDAALIEQMNTVDAKERQCGNYQNYPESTKIYLRKGMTAALAVVRAHFAAHPPEGWLNEALADLSPEERKSLPWNDTCRDMVTNLIRNRRARLSAPQKPDPAVERVVVCTHLSKCWSRVDLDGKEVCFFSARSHDLDARRYAAGLRLELAHAALDEKDKGERHE